MPGAKSAGHYCLRSHPVSRVLCLCDHLSGTRITPCLKRRSQARRALAIPGEDECAQAAPSCLASDGVYPAPASPQGPVRSYFKSRRTAPFRPYHLSFKRWRYVSVALSGGSPRPAVSRHRCPVKPGLSSDASPAGHAVATRMTSALSIAQITVKFFCAGADNALMNALDIGLVILIAAAGVVGLVRGFGRTGLDTLAVYAALWVASLASVPLAAHLSLHAGGAGVNQSWAFSLLLVVSVALLLGVSWYVYSLTQFDAGMFDKLLGLAAGVVAGVILAHGVTQALVTADPQCVASAAPVNTGSVSPELYGFSQYHAVMDTITGSKTYMRDAPSPATMAGK